MRLLLLNHEVSSIHAAALILGAAGLLSRLVGVLRNRLLFAEFGAGRELDIYYVSFQIPDFMAALFLLGAASAAVLPVFQERLLENKRKAQEFIASLVGLFFLGSTAASAAAFLAVPLAVPYAAPGFSPQEQALVVSITRVMLLSPILFGLSSIFSVVVQTFGRFFVYAAAPILYNLGIIFGIVFLVPALGIYGLGIGVVAGALLHFGLQFGVAVQIGYPRLSALNLVWVRMIQFMRYDLVNNFDLVNKFRAGLDQGIRRVVLLSFPRTLAISLHQLTLLALFAIGSLLAEGSVALFSAAQDLYFVPIGIFGISYAVALFPRLSEAVLRRSGDEFLRDLSAGIRSILFWVAPSAALFLVLRAHIVRVALGAGQFSWEDTRLTAALLAVLALAMAAGAAQILLIRGFYALGNTRLPLVINAVASIGTIALAWILTAALASGSALSRGIAAVLRIGDLPHPEVLGLGIGFAAGTIINTGLLYVFLMKEAEEVLGKKPDRGSAAEIVKIVAAALVGAGAGYGVRVSFSETLPLITFVRVLVQGAASAAAGFAVYCGLLAALGSREVGILRRGITRRLLSIGILPKSWDGEDRVTGN